MPKIPPEQVSTYPCAAGAERATSEKGREQQATALVHDRFGDRGDGEDGGDGGDSPDELVPDPRVWKELGITSMTGWRYTRDATLNFPPAINIRGRNFRSRKMLEAWKRYMIARATAKHNEAKRTEVAAAE